MKPEEKLIASINKAVRDLWHYEGVECPALVKAIKEYESTPKPWAPPWALKIPDWPEVWAFANPSGNVWFEDREPVESSDGYSTVGGNIDYVYRFEIPPGTDWTTMKVRVK